MELDGLRLEPDGGGSASLTVAELSKRLGTSIGSDLARLLTRPVEVVGIRFLDSDGRELDPGQTVVIVGFRPGLEQ